MYSNISGAWNVEIMNELCIQGQNLCQRSLEQDVNVANAHLVSFYMHTVFIVIDIYNIHIWLYIILYLLLRHGLLHYRPFLNCTVVAYGGICELHADLARCAGKVSHENPGSQIIINLHWDETRIPLFNLGLDNHHFIAVHWIRPNSVLFEVLRRRSQTSSRLLPGFHASAIWLIRGRVSAESTCNMWAMSEETCDSPCCQVEDGYVDFLLYPTHLPEFWSWHVCAHQAPLSWRTFSLLLLRPSHAFHWLNGWTLSKSTAGIASHHGLELLEQYVNHTTSVALVDLWFVTLGNLEDHRSYMLIHW